MVMYSLIEQNIDYSILCQYYRDEPNDSVTEPECSNPRLR